MLTKGHGLYYREVGKGCRRCLGVFVVGGSWPFLEVHGIHVQSVGFVTDVGKRESFFIKSVLLVLLFGTARFWKATVTTSNVEFYVDTVLLTMAEATEGSDDSPTNNSSMDTNPTNPSPNADTGPAPPVLLSGPRSPWYQARWRLEIRLPNDTNLAFDAGKAYSNFVSTTLQAFPNVIHFCTNDGSEYFSNQSQVPPPLSYPTYFQGAKSHRPEHGAYRFYMVITVQTLGLSIQNMKQNKQFLQFLHSTDAWLTYHNLDTLDIQAAGVFTLRHPQWTLMEGFHWRAEMALETYLHDLDIGTLPPDQVAAVRPYKLYGQALPKFDLCIQNVRAYYARSSTRNPQAASSKPQAKFISAEAIEFRCSRAHLDLFLCLLDGVTSKDIWSLGQFASYQLRSDSPDHFRACVAEQNTFVQSTSYILIQNAAGRVFDGQVPLDTVNNYEGFTDTTSTV